MSGCPQIDGIPGRSRFLYLVQGPVVTYLTSVPLHHCSFARLTAALERTLFLRMHAQESYVSVASPPSSSVSPGKKAKRTRTETDGQIQLRKNTAEAVYATKNAASSHRPWRPPPHFGVSLVFRTFRCVAWLISLLPMNLSLLWIVFLNYLTEIMKCGFAGYRVGRPSAKGPKRCAARVPICRIQMSNSNGIAWGKP